MKYDLFFKMAKEAGLEEAELYINRSTSLSFQLFHGEVVAYENNDSQNVYARGLLHGKAGAASCDTFSKEKCAYLVKEIVQNAKVIENEDPIVIFEGSPRYKKVSSFNKALHDIPFQTKLDKMHKLEAAIKAGDPRIVEVEAVAYSESSEEVLLLNSKGLDLHSKSNYFVTYGAAVAQENGQVKSNYEMKFGNDFDELDEEELARKVVENTVAQLGGEPCESGKYKTVLAPSVVASLLKVFCNYASAEEVQKKSSLLIGKLGQKVASSKVTIEDRPLDKSLFARWFDDEGVATSNKPIVKNGVLNTYLYNLTTAAKEGVQSTGNGYRRGSSVGVSSPYLVLRPGKKSQEELFAEVGDGVYITEVQGLHAGLNPQSGNFSLQSTGFLIKDGKKDRALDIVTVSGNLLSLFGDVIAVGSDSKSLPSGVCCPSVVVRKLGVSGK